MSIIRKSLKWVFALGLLLTTSFLVAETEQSQPHSVMCILEAKPGKENQLRDALMKVAKFSRLEDSCIEYHVYQDANTPTLFSLYENWQSAELHQEQFKKPYILELLAVSDELLAKPYMGVMGKELAAPK